MNFGRRIYIVIFVVTGLFFFSQSVLAVLFEPGAGVGLEYTNNARLTLDDQISDLVATTYVGARVTEDEGALKYGAATSFNRHSYVHDSYDDQRYFNLGANADWEMIKDRFNWFLADNFYQNSISSLGANTPDNIQDSNVFTFGALARLPLSARQSFSLTPTFSQYYYEVLHTDNKQYSLTANWNYQMFRLTNVGLVLSGRKINYTETDIFGRSPDNTEFTNMAIIVNGQRLRSSFLINLGATNVKRDNGQETTEFAGYLDWQTDISSRSTFETRVSTDLTDASSVAAGQTGGGVQITADVIRTSILNLTYSRDDATLNTRLSGRYNRVLYSESPLDRIIRSLDLQFSYPVTQRLSSSAYVYYNRIRQLEIDREDERVTVGGNLRYNFSRKIHGLFDLKYRNRKSTISALDYDEYSIFISLVYGYGEVGRATRTGGF